MDSRFPKISQRIHYLCETFESAWRADALRPKIEVYLQAVPEDAYENCLLRLVQLELELREAQGDPPSSTEYTTRFPAYADTVKTAFRDAACDESSLLGSLSGLDAPAKEFDAETLPDPFGPFNVKRRIGVGGMATVYEATDTRLSRSVALKVPLYSQRSDPVLRARFTREARAVGKLQHPNICAVYESGVIEGVPYISMRYVRGKTLKDHVKGHRLTER